MTPPRFLESLASGGLESGFRTTSPIMPGDTAARSTLGVVVFRPWDPKATSACELCYPEGLARPRPRLGFPFNLFACNWRNLLVWPARVSGAARGYLLSKGDCGQLPPGPRRQEVSTPFRKLCESPHSHSPQISLLLTPNCSLQGWEKEEWWK